jgi:hypothetical protein
MKIKSEAAYLEKWIDKGKGLGKEPPKASDAPYNLDADDLLPGMEQINIKVPRGTKERLRQLGIQEGGLSMRRMFKRMVDEFEERHRSKKAKR